MSDDSDSDELLKNRSKTEEEKVVPFRFFCFFKDLFF